MKKFQASSTRALRRSRLTLSAVLLVLIVSGCSTNASQWAQEYNALDRSDLQADAQEVVDCMQEGGFAAEAGSDGSVQTPELPEEQLDLSETAMRACMIDTSFSVIPESPSEAKLEELYGLEIEASRCLADLGYHTSTPPSLQTYSENVNTGEGWHAYSDVADQLTGADANSVPEECPDPMWFSSRILQ